MYSLYANDDNISYGIQRFIVDTEEDIDFLPISTKPGSSALVIDTSSFYILNHSKKWIKLKKENNNSSQGFLEWQTFF